MSLFSLFYRLTNLSKYVIQAPYPEERFKESIGIIQNALNVHAFRSDLNTTLGGMYEISVESLSFKPP
jgi:hypothetical protein